MGCLSSKCGCHCPKVWSVEKSEQQRRHGAYTIVYHRRNGRQQNAFVWPEDADLKLDGRFDYQSGGSPDIQTDSEEFGEKGFKEELSAEVTSQGIREIINSDPGAIELQIEDEVSEGLLYQSKASLENRVLSTAALGSGTISESRPGDMSERKSPSTGDMSERKSPSADANGSFRKPGAYTTNASTRHHCSSVDLYGDICESDDELPVQDHQTLWRVLSAVPGWERDVHEGITDIAEGYVNFQKWTENAERALLITSYRLPWPDLYKASTDHLRGFVKLVNICMGSEIFELRFELRISNDRPPLLKKHVVNDFLRNSLIPKNVVDGFEFRCASSAAHAEKCPRVRRQRNVRTAVLPSIYSSLSQAGSLIGSAGGYVGTAAALIVQRSRSSEDSLSRGSHTFEVSEQPPLMVPPGQFVYFEKPSLPSTPVVLSGHVAPPSLAKRPGLAAGATRLFTSTPSGPLGNKVVDSVRARYRQQFVTFATPYQSPQRGPASSFIGDHPRQDAWTQLLNDFLAPVTGICSRVTV